MKLSTEGAAFISRFEGFRGKPYNDPVGHATIGFGHLLHHGPVTSADRAKWRTISRERGLQLLRQDAARFERAVEQAVRVKLSQPQFDALVSFAFNVGGGALASSTLVKLLNQDRRMSAADELLKWDKAGGQSLPGLTRRRKAERKLFRAGLYTDKKTEVTKVDGPSPHFTWQEVHRGRGGFTAAIRARAVAHAKKLERLRTAINRERKKHGLKPTGINILSWWRPRWYNDLVGGAVNSRHIQGDATDISREEVRRLCPWRDGPAEFDALSDWVFANDGFGQYPAGSRHVDSRGTRARWRSF